MSEAEAEKSHSAARLRRPERRQMAMVVECTDDLVSSTHAVRMVMAVVEKLDLSRFQEPIKAREGQAGRDATDPQSLVALWLYACIRGIGSARELARPGQSTMRGTVVRPGLQRNALRHRAVELKDHSREEKPQPGKASSPAMPANRAPRSRLTV